MVLQGAQGGLLDRFNLADLTEVYEYLVCSSEFRAYHILILSTLTPKRFRQLFYYKKMWRFWQPWKSGCLLVKYYGNIKRNCDAQMVESKKDALIFTTNFRPGDYKWNVLLKAWFRVKWCLSVPQLLSVIFHWPSKDAANKRVQSHSNDRLFLSNCLLNSWTCFDLGGFLLSLCLLRYLTWCLFVLWSYLHTTY